MQFSQEFFIQRSFEVVWAVFRVAGYMTREKMRDILEDRAVEYLLYKDTQSIISLEEVVRLAMHINEITDINGKVILREINNLKSVLNDINGTEGQISLNKRVPENAPNVEEIFSKPPMLLSDFMGMVDNLPESGKNEKKSLAKEDFDEKSGKKDEKGENGLNTNKTAEKVWQSLAKSGKDESPAKSGKENNKVFTANPVEISSNGVNREKTARKTQRTHPGARIRRNEILNMVKERNLCHIKDIMESMPKISPRTIRYDIQQMVDKGVLERVGSGGPNSFFRIKT